MKAKYYLTVFIALFLSTNANSASIDESFNECTAIAADDFALDECYSTAISAYETKIQKSVNEILNSGIEDNFKNDLKNSQRAWINYREMTSKVLYEAQDGIAASVVSSDFILQSTKKQALILEDLKKTLGL